MGKCTTEARAREIFNSLKDDFCTFPWDESRTECWVGILRLIADKYGTSIAYAVVVGLKSGADGVYIVSSAPNKNTIAGILPEVFFSSLSPWTNVENHSFESYIELDFWAPGG